jgi:hypothetical protein
LFVESWREGGWYGTDLEIHHCSDEMHADGEVGHVEGAPVLRIGEVPYPTQDFYRKLRLEEDIPGFVPAQETINRRALGKETLGFQPVLLGNRWDLSQRQIRQ